MNLGLGLGLSGVVVRGGLIAPPGYIFVVDADGAYLTDADGAYLIEAI